MKVDEWNRDYNEDSFFFRPHSDQDHENLKVPEPDCGENESGHNAGKVKGDHCIKSR